MKTPFMIFIKSHSPEIHLSMVDDWIINVIEFYRGKVSHRCQIILGDLKQYKGRRKQEGYTYIRRTR